MKSKPIKSINIVGTVYLMLALLIIYGFAITYKNIAFVALLPLICYQSITIFSLATHAMVHTGITPILLYGM